MASCVQYRLIIRDVNTLQILQLYTCLDQIQYIEWSSDSLFILCAMYKRGIVQVWSLEQPDWHCKIDEGSAGLVASCWSPDGRHILNTTEFHLRITVWSLCTKSVSYIKYPKACQQEYVLAPPGRGVSSPSGMHVRDQPQCATYCECCTEIWSAVVGLPVPGGGLRLVQVPVLRMSGIAFTKDGRYMALAERRDCKDFISLFVCSDWQLLRHFDTETQDLFGIEWAPNGCVLAVWDTCLEYKILLYSLDGRLLSTYRAYEWSLGIKSIAWSPSSQFLAIGSYDEKVRILNHVTWKKITEFEHPATITNPKTIVYKEVEKSPSVETERLSFPRRALASSLFSAQSKYNIPNAVWIWDIQKLKLFVVLEQLGAIQSFQWDPLQPRLAICTGNSKVYLWSPAGCVSVQVPMEGDFQILSLCWHSSGDSVALLSKDNFCVCYLEREEVK
ncbi:WD repeat-containing protein WRAP73 isoform X2 [Apteryx rowi]|uniref:WD repeat-containing protein WRAP73 isoform X2 n=1 Tax=Apteryx rowi TaxID=308060 RepID=UPI000E1CAE45|nr:WD repeat-containing protein WRAP73 isoform X2 [Apteryx rowi]